ncbi:putative HTH-type transcriptional regulator YdfH [Maioricimonas rarisocia]|uniref:Putative HTH-type transcriptional regulator YdfH n=1 Tax=Maioricimonas rarisocia TaxID=2528026 RepID=A0A517Z3V3_9PLAN|nr:GntR family transcriptional regulator [Maioricimonas rarisocia]QDU37170.1 putative HTH-type transcriptional regulator YdfH [Maioricimonas rarisocia]
MATVTSTKRSPADEQPGVDHGQRRKIVVENLLGDIFRGRLKAGERLIIRSLAERFQMSPTPIREALVALEGIGIVDIAPNCGAVVRRVTATDVKEVCQVRRALECAAVKLACGNIAPLELEELADQFRRRGQNIRTVQRRNGAVRKAIDQARALDSRLHDLIADSCGNRFLSRELARMKLLFRTFRDAAWDRREDRPELLRLPEEAREHLAIVEALLANDASAAARAMARHIRSGVKYWSRGLPTQT